MQARAAPRSMVCTATILEGTDGACIAILIGISYMNHLCIYMVMS